MKQIGSLGTLILGFLVAFSCQKEIDLKAQTPPGQLYANSILNPDSVFRVFISYSTLITAPLEDIHDKLDLAKESILVIKDDAGALIDTLEFIRGVYSGVNSSFLVFESIEGLRPLANQTYELQVHEYSNKNSKFISAKVSVPTVLNPILAKKSIPAREITGEDQTFGIELSWKDPSRQEDNFFIIEATYKMTNLASGSSEFIKSALYSLDYQNDNIEIGPANGKFFYIFINDSRLSGPIQLDSIHTKISVPVDIFDLWATPGTAFNGKILIHVHHVSKDLYNYYQDVEKYRINSSGTDIFAQPIPVKGNIQGGLGILGAEIIQESILVYQ
ncbi:MAG: Unknown protein [uncultured Aureispira sp.]|uniref:DUF4249 domain-containing protein n=1 Tax=uncultured Aureispira sp. TaxID=1331704 RepID=A0A6S6UH37_9BACT|nr:MAG: Unknown protein [uncultured Aureispira sp.]